MYPAPLPPKEQAALCHRAQQGDIAARNYLVSRSLGLVYKQANSWSRSTKILELQELVAEGVLGLIATIERYDPTKGATFATYASLWISQRLNAAVAGAKGLKQSDNRRRKFARGVAMLLAEGESIERAAEIVAAQYGVGRATVRGVFEAITRPNPLSLDQPVAGYMDGGTLGDTVPSLEEAVEVRLGDAQERRIVRQVVDRVRRGLPKREQVILDERFLNDEMTLADIGAKFSISRERVRQLEVVVREKIKVALAKVLKGRVERPRVQRHPRGLRRRPCTPRASRAVAA